MNNLNFKNIKGLLSRDEMRQIKGGSGGSCGFRTDNRSHIFCNLTMAQAQRAAAKNGGYWCCASCASNGGSASYC